MSRVLNAEGAGNGLDVGVSLLTFGLLPQRVLLHGEAGDRDPGMRPRPHPQDLRRLTFSSQDTTFPSPCFDFGEKVSRYLRSQNDKISVLYINRISFIKIEEIDNLGNYKYHSTLSVPKLINKNMKMV